VKTTNTVDSLTLFSLSVILSTDVARFLDTWVPQWPPLTDIINFHIRTVYFLYYQVFLFNQLMHN